MQLYDPYLKNQTAPSNEPMQQTAEFKKFELTEDRGLNFDTDFMLNPKKFFCKKHPSSEIEFCCEIREEFYCRKCVGDHEGHKNDRVLN
jgi:hypothetical protein